MKHYLHYAKYLILAVGFMFFQIFAASLATTDLTSSLPLPVMPEDYVETKNQPSDQAESKQNLENMEKDPLIGEDTQPANDKNDKQEEEHFQTIMVPSGTVLNIMLNQPLSSSRNKEGEIVQAKITQALNIGPYLVISPGATIKGKITELNDSDNKQNPHPYMIVSFKELKRTVDKEYIPFSGLLIAYKTGLRGHEYVWRLPEKGERTKTHLKGAMIGAVSGAFWNPVIGPVVGVGASLLKSVVMDRFARGGDVDLKADEEIPIAVEESFSIAIEENTSNKKQDKLSQNLGQFEDKLK